MALFKKKLHVEAAMRMMLRASLSRDPRRALAEVASGGILQQEDVARVERELLPFDLALWHALFLDHFRAQTEELVEDLSAKFATALMFALRDAGVADSALESRADELINSAFGYLEALTSASPQELKGGRYFYYCQQFTRRVLSGIDLRLEPDRNRHFQVFDIAKQNYEATRQAHDGLLREYKLLNE
jgi:hypothetical protein